MYGRGYIRIGLHEGATVVPINSVDFGGKIPHVLVAAGDRVTRRNVTIGTELDRGSYLEILDGVSPDELVVIAGADGLTDGSKVRIQKERTESNSQKGSAAPPAAASHALPSAASPSPVSPVASNRP
jgi:multidrug efflux pump subunit AcrA (membrane-fusion protein)